MAYKKNVSAKSLMTQFKANYPQLTQSEKFQNAEWARKAVRVLLSHPHYKDSHGELRHFPNGIEGVINTGEETQVVHTWGSTTGNCMTRVIREGYTPEEAKKAIKEMMKISPSFAKQMK